MEYFKQTEMIHAEKNKFIQGPVLDYVNTCNLPQVYFNEDTENEIKFFCLDHKPAKCMLPATG